MMRRRRLSFPIRGRLRSWKGLTNPRPASQLTPKVRRMMEDWTKAGFRGIPSRTLVLRRGLCPLLWERWKP